MNMYKIREVMAVFGFVALGFVHNLGTNWVCKDFECEKT